MKRPHLPLTHALAWIVLSTLVVSGSAHLAFRFYSQHKARLAHDPRYAIRTIVQTGPQKEALKTEYLAEIIGISADRPPSSLTFDLEAAKDRLLHSPLISRAELKVIAPSTLYVDYTVRQPIAWIYDYENVVIDRDGHPFPFRPFFSPKNLPEIYLGSSESDIYHKSLDCKQMRLALDLFQLLTDPKLRDLFQLKRIDVSNAFAESYGTREIVVIVEDTILSQQSETIFPKMLRLTTKGYAQELGNYLKLREQLVEQERKTIRTPPEGGSPIREKAKIIDLRISNLAFIDE